MTSLRTYLNVSLSKQPLSRCEGPVCPPSVERCREVGAQATSTDRHLPASVKHCHLIPRVLWARVPHAASLPHCSPRAEAKRGPSVLSLRPALWPPALASPSETSPAHRGKKDANKFCPPPETPSARQTLEGTDSWYRRQGQTRVLGPGLASRPSPTPLTLTTCLDFSASQSADQKEASPTVSA